MTPLRRFNSILVLTTVAIMFVALGWLAPGIVAAGLPAALGGAVGGALTSVGTYRVLTMILEFLLGKSQWVKKKVFGSYYMEGQWVGYFVGHANDIRFVIEYFDQGFDRLSLRGMSYDGQGRLHATWKCESAYLDAETGALDYLYACDILTKKVTHQGVGTFMLIRDSSRHAATEMQGTVTDLVDGKRLPVRETRIGSGRVDTHKALSMAAEFARSQGAATVEVAVQQADAANGPLGRR